MSVQFDLRDDVALITLDRPDRFNAINHDLVDRLTEALHRAGTESRAAVLTGAGKAFCSGADLSILKDDYDSGSPDLGALLEDVFHPMIHALLDSPVPIIGAINGVAAGAGMGVALACDIRLFAESAFLTSAFGAIGLAPDSGTTWWLPAHVGVSKALDITLTNRRVGAEESKDLGLAYQVVADEDVVDESLRLAGQLADLVPDSLVTTRRLIRNSGALGLADALESERFEQARLGRTPEHREGVMAFLETRDADFRTAR